MLEFSRSEDLIPLSLLFCLLRIINHVFMANINRTGNRPTKNLSTNLVVIILSFYNDGKIPEST